MLTREGLELRDQLAAVVSHDLRTPLSAIVNGIQALLTGGKLQGTDNEIAARTARSAERMRRLIGLLTGYWSVCASGGIPIERRHSSLNDLVEQAVNEAQAANPNFITHQLVQAHGGTIEIDSHDARGTTVSIRLPIAG
jgi:signal transduction histidine kinase